MAITATGLSSYTDKATQLLTAGVLLADDLDRYSLEDDVQSSKYLNFVDTTLYPLAGSCGLTSSGTTTFTEKSISVTPIAYQLQYCFEELQEKAIKIERQAIAKGLQDTSWESIFTDQNINKVKQNVESQLWVGATASGNFFDGWATIALAASDRVLIDSTYTGYSQTAITTTAISNIINSFCDKIVDTSALWAQVGNGEKVTIHCAPNIYNTYKQYLLSSNLFRDVDKDLAVKEQWVSAYEGQISIKEEPALEVTARTSSPKMLATIDKNLYMGSSLVNDVTAPKAKWVIDSVTDYVYFKTAFRLGAQVAFTNQVVTFY